jgi:hypothetical protein
LRTRPEPTQLEHLSDASFLGELLVFPVNVRLDWKVIASTKTLAYLASLTVMKEKCFITLTLGANVIKLFLHVNYRFSYQARVFVRLDWKSLPNTNTLAYYENP